MQEWNEKRKIEVEKNFLLKAKALLKERTRGSHIEADPFTRSKINVLIDRMIDNEIDFLLTEADVYFDLYCKDHLGN